MEEDKNSYILAFFGSGMDPIKKSDGPCVVLAGAGTGKTHTIVEKIKYLIKEGIYLPERVVCITFSNEAANNLLSRVEKELGVGKGPVVKTFHAFSADLLRKFGTEIGVSEKFKVLDPNEAKVVLFRSLRIPAVNCHKYISTIGTAKDLGIRLEDLEKYVEEEKSRFNGLDLEKKVENLQFELQTLHLGKENREKKKELVSGIAKISKLLAISKFLKAWGAYEKLKEKHRYLDYSDLSNKAVELVSKNKQVAESFDYFIVDEFQDTNKVQLDFLSEICLKGDITVVGDLNQSIYRFRGAYRKNFDLFKARFNVSEKDIFNLDKSYRSSNKVLKAAHDLIVNNYVNKEECFFVENFENREGDKIESYELKNGKEEARKVVELVKKEKDSGVREEEICVMFRTHQQGRVIKKALEFAGIAYCAVSKESLLKQKSVKIVVDYLTILDKLRKGDKGAEQEWWDLIYRLDFLESDLIKIGRFIKDNRECDCLSKEMLRSLTNLQLSLSGKMCARVLIERLKVLLKESMEKSLADLTKDIFSVSGLLDGKKEKESLLNLNKFLELTASHESLYDGDLASFIHYLSVLDSLGIEVPAAEIESSGVRLMTSHSTKGLEYKTVIITNMAQKKFPMERYVGNALLPVELLPELKEELSGLDKLEKEYYVKEYEKKQQILDERRLCYVSFTRAKNNLILTHANQYGGRKFFPSQFLQEIDYKKNRDVNFFVDLDNKYREPDLQIKTGFDLQSALNKPGFEDLLINGIKKIDSREKTKKEHRHFSPSALLLFEKCQKNFEYKYVYNMPDKKSVSWEAMLLGSFVHRVLELGVNEHFDSLDRFLQRSRDLSRESEWEAVDMDDAEHLIKVFYERNKDKYGEKSKTEQKLKMEIGGLKFIGYADRMDFSAEGIEIVDYKTGKWPISPKSRNWQLGYYVLAASSLGKVKRITLEMLKQEKPLEFELDDKGNAEPVNSNRMSGFNVYEVEQEIIKAAHAVQEAYKSGFKACPIEENCEFCNEYVYNL